MKDKLSIKQQKFAEKYIETGNATQSYIDAGYKVTKKEHAEVNASKLLRNHKVKEYIDSRMRELQKPTIASQEEVLEYLTKVMRGQEKDAFGLDIGIKDRTDAAKLIGQRYGTFIDKKDVSAKVETNIKVTLEDDS